MQYNLQGSYFEGFGPAINLPKCAASLNDSDQATLISVCPIVDGKKKEEEQEQSSVVNAST